MKDNQYLERPPGPWEGTHAKVLLHRAKFDMLNSVKFIDKLLDDLVTAIGMQPLGKMVKDIPLEVGKLGGHVFEDEGGISGIIVLSTSHCTIHTWPLRASACMDVYSCKQFDCGIVHKFLVERFELADEDVLIKDISDVLVPPEDWRSEEDKFT